MAVTHRLITAHTTVPCVVVSESPVGERWRVTRRVECGWVLAQPATAASQARSSRTYLQRHTHITLHRGYVFIG